MLKSIKFISSVFLLFVACAYSATINGTITDASTGTPVTGAIVVLTSVGGGGGGADTTTTDASGSYTFSDVTTGFRLITVSMTGYLNATNFVNVDNANGTQTVDIELDAIGSGEGTIQGTITSSGDNSPIIGAMVVLAVLQGGGPGGGLGMAVDTIMTDANGAYIFSSLNTDLNYSITASADGFEENSENVNQFNQNVVSVNIELDVFVPPNSGIEGTVTNENDDTPLEGVLVELLTRSFGGGQFSYQSIGSTNTGTNGEYAFYGLEPSGIGVTYVIVVGNYDTTNFVQVLNNDTATVDIQIDPDLIVSIYSSSLQNQSQGLDIVWTGNQIEFLSQGGYAVIYNLSGEVVATKILSFGLNEISIKRSLASSVLFLSISNKNMSSIYKIHK